MAAVSKSICWLMLAMTPLFINSRIILIGLIFTRAARSRTLMMLGISTIFSAIPHLQVIRRSPVADRLRRCGAACFNGQAARYGGQNPLRLRRYDDAGSDSTLRVHLLSEALLHRLAAPPDRLPQSDQV